MNIRIDCSSNMNSELIKSRIWRYFHGDFAFVNIEMINYFDCYHFNWEKRIYWRSFVNPVFLWFIHKFFDDFQVFLLLVFCFVELLETTVENFAFELRN